MPSQRVTMLRNLVVCPLAIAVAAGCQRQPETVATQTKAPGIESSQEPSVTPEPEPPSRVQGTSDREVITFVESLIELKSIEDAFALIHPQCLPTLEGEEQRKVCNQKLENSIQSADEDVFLVSEYDSSKTFWKPGEFQTAVAPELVVTTREDWNTAYFPFQDGFIKWLLAKDGDQWRIVMPAVQDLKSIREKRSYEGAVRESNMTQEEQLLYAADVAKTLPAEFKAELKELIEAGDRLKAIKRCNTELGSGLTVSRAIIENLKAEWAAPQEPPANADEVAKPKDSDTENSNTENPNSENTSKETSTEKSSSENKEAR